MFFSFSNMCAFVNIACLQYYVWSTLALLQCLRCQSPAHLLSCCVLAGTPFHCEGAAFLIQKMPGYPLQERTRTVGWDHWYGTYDMHVVTVDTWNHELGRHATQALCHARRSFTGVVRRRRRRRLSLFVIQTQWRRRASFYKRAGAMEEAHRRACRRCREGALVEGGDVERLLQS